MDYISIPFSTIKREYAKEMWDYTNLFQFHLVRLKACSDSFAAQDFPPFQFHLVRLKGYQPLTMRYDGSKFQFHLVRLKGRPKIINLLKHQYFNSI